MTGIAECGPDGLEGARGAAGAAEPRQRPPGGPGRDEEA
jgi:hypothetical protein